MEGDAGRGKAGCGGVDAGWLPEIVLEWLRAAGAAACLEGEGPREETDAAGGTNGLMSVLAVEEAEEEDCDKGEADDDEEEEEEEEEEEDPADV
jgi:Ran GTPase-activating protein (RanGAP) involved in mRNA processing and transport